MQFKVYTLQKQVAISCFCLFAIIGSSSAQKQPKDSFKLYNDVTATIDKPGKFDSKNETYIILYALPNGNSTAATIGKKVNENDDWHYDIQHIGAQATFIRQKLAHKNIILVYLENEYKSWPLWKQKHPGYKQEIQHIVDTLYQIGKGRQKKIFLNGHSGGGSFIFGYLQGLDTIPGFVQRISFLDSDYGYDSSYYKKLWHWLQSDPAHHLNVFAYNDSVALYQGKPFVSATGGTWYRSHLMLKHFAADVDFQKTNIGEIDVYSARQKQVQFFFKENPLREIYHTTQVERNGFIHSILAATVFDSDGYTYYGPRAYSQFIR